MDQLELRSGKTVIKNYQKSESEDDPEEDMESLVEAGYATGGNAEE